MFSTGRPPTTHSRTRLAAGLAVALSGAALAVVPALSIPAQAVSPGLVISEVYGGGGNSGATLTHDFIEIYNRSNAPISVDGMSVQYRSSGNTGTGVTALTGSVPAGGYYLVQEAQGSGGTQALPTPDATGTLAMSGTNGIVFLAQGTAPITLTSAATAGVVDLVGFGSAAISETAPAPALTNTTSASRLAGNVDTDNNAVDFAVGAPTPTNAGAVDPDPDPDPVVTEATIAEIQGTGPASPMAGADVITQGVVTGVYPTGGFNGFVIQTGGPDTTPGASDGLFVFGPTFDESTLAIGDSVEVEGTVSEFGSLTEVTATSVTDIAALPAAVPSSTIPGTDCSLPGTDCLTGAALDSAKEEVESELFQPTGDFTVTDAYDGSAYNGGSFSSSFFGEIGVAANSATSLVTPTEVIDAQDTAAIAARKAYNDAHRVILDDGASTTYWNTGGTARDDLPFPWFTADHTVRVGAAVAFPAPVILDYRFGWKIQPQSQVVGEPTGKVTFEQTRTLAPEGVGGDLKLATFNVLNYFTTLGVDVAGCTSFKDRNDVPIAVNSCPGAGPRGAWDTPSFERQQAKIVAAINAMDADIVSVEEIENSLVVDGHDRDEALANLVTALNAASAPGRWDYVRSPSVLPTGEDVIRTGFIYDPSSVEPVGEAEMLTTGGAFDNAREPFAQVFRPAGAAPDATSFAVIVNHFKSKGSGTPDPFGQGNANVDRVAQAQALAAFADEFSASRGVEAVFLTGDINSYSQEDPMQVLYGAGYVKLDSDTSDEYSYSFDGQSGSLDHVLANPAAAAMVEGVDIWEINANETVFNQYSRFNYNVTNLYSPTPFSASDHNPEVVGINALPDLPASQIVATHTPHKVQAGKTRPKLRLTISSDGLPVTGSVQVVVPGTVEGSVTLEAELTDGMAMLHLPAFASPGSQTLSITYSGSDEVAGSTTDYVIEVVARH